MPRPPRRKGASSEAKLGEPAGLYALGVLFGIARRGLYAGVAYALIVRGALTLDLGMGRRNRSLGPIDLHIAAPRETVFDVIAAPYLKRTPRAMAGKLDVLERGSDMVLAAHFTPLGRGMTATTVETVRFKRPELISFRLLRGPVPHVVETFELKEAAGGGTHFEYRGELGTDLWAAGAWWGERVARSWVRAVEESLAGIRTEAERRAAPRG
jgi:hypothetical protein